MKLSTSQIRYLRGEAHKLKPIVMVGANGVTENLLEELNIALNSHELVKVKVRAEEREERDAMIDLLCKKSGAVKVQRIGHNLTIYRQNKDKPRYQLPK
ncbi:MAG: ribosome assembly RNA-binding protein YhbY [Kangiellaceae bacterium]|jgi:RNA-binding protein|nr:ribosome assembly RNA-binding protein YhbY [Kangiellaceae bacterium]